MSVDPKAPAVFFIVGNSRSGTTMLTRMLRVISTAELNRFIETIADAGENPDDRSYCQIIKDGDKDNQ